MEAQEILFEEIPGKEGALAVITLNRPQALNALNLAMIHTIYSQLQYVAHANHIKAVIIRAVPGRAFCAGGDLRLIYHHAKEQAANHYFRDEYQLNRFIFHFPKPYIALLDGITMGGGVGISIHGSHRIATENLVFAMPETGIGFFPDVGGTYFLPRLPYGIGFYLALTGAKLNADECVVLGLAQHKIASHDLSSVMDVLANQPLGAHPKEAVTHILQSFAQAVETSPMLQEQASIQSCFSAKTMEEIIETLQHDKNALCQQAVNVLLKKSPTSLKVTLRALQEGAHLDFDACMQQEYYLSSQFLQSHDFPEGIRALIVDKDQVPRWQPNTLQAVTAEQVEKYFLSH